MHRLLYSAAPLLAGSLAMGTPLASPLTEICDRSMVRTAAGGSASDAPRCPFCRTRAAVIRGGDSIPLRAPLWNRAIPANATYPAQAMADSGSSSTQGAEGLKMCMTCHDGALAGVLSNAATDAENAPDQASGKHNAGGQARP